LSTLEFGGRSPCLENDIIAGLNMGDQIADCRVEHPFSPVSLDRITNRFSGGNANSQNVLLVRNENQNNKRVGKGTSMLPHPLEISRLPEAILFFHQLVGISRGASVPNHCLWVVTCCSSQFS